MRHGSSLNILVSDNELKFLTHGHEMRVVVDARLSFKDVEGDYRRLETEQYQEYERFLD